MTLWINIVFAWIALILAFFSVVIWVLRLITKKKKIQPVSRANRWLRRHHKLIGILLIGAGVIHGLFSSDKLFSVNLGTAVWVVSILLGLSWIFRKKLKKAWMSIHRLLTVAFVALLVIHIVSVGGFILDDMIVGRITPPPAQTQTEQTAAPTETAASAPDAAAEATPTQVPDAVETTTEAPPPAPADPPSTGGYIDGTYLGTGTGFGPGLVVEVVIEDGMITRITVVDHNERNQRYWGYPVEQIPKDIIAAQSTDVDNITGATMTCDGIKEAVDDALAQALAG